MDAMIRDSKTRRCTRPLGIAVAMAVTAGMASAHTDLLYPDGGQVFQPGETITIQWTVAIEHTLVDWDLWYSTHGDAGPYVPIAMGIPPGDPTLGSLHTLDWVVPDEPGAQAVIKVRMNGPAAFWESTSEIPFTITGAMGTQECPGQSVNSTGASGALLLVGSDRASDNDLQLSVSNLPPGVFGMAVNSDVAGFTPSAGGSDGTLCLGGIIGRHVNQVSLSSAEGHVALPIDLTSVPRGPSSAAVLAGQTLRFQWWHRDANPSVTSNYSDSRSLTFR